MAAVVFALKIWRSYLYGAKCKNLVIDYDLEILYHPGKANSVADALSQKRAVSTQELDMETLVREISALILCAFSQEPLRLEAADRVSANSTILVHGRICVPKDEVLRQDILREAHASIFSIHTGATKMYHDLKRYYYWVGMKKDVASWGSVMFAS
ncbi:PREDICTED: uncharacterized protein LOC109131261 [Camelina sativa]|uniref:Uncharacterized protein LOC109131261 n=1 Tax=Camelina sativa TaxID=90675 RepID=A0ABM1RES1_CAMSA|nr:PREDICTED: uncharacterized protein LOC109131261 [Camelina sativa]